MAQSLDLQWHLPNLLVYHQGDRPTLCLGGTKTATGLTLQSKPHPLIASGLATVTLVSISRHYKRVSSGYASVSHHLCRDLAGHHWVSCGHGCIDSDCVQRSEGTNRGKR